MTPSLFRLNPGTTALVEHVPLVAANLVEAGTSPRVSAHLHEVAVATIRARATRAGWLIIESTWSAATVEHPAWRGRRLIEAGRLPPRWSYRVKVLAWWLEVSEQHGLA